MFPETVTEVDVVYLVRDENDSKDVEPTVTLDDDVTELGGPLQNKERYKWALSDNEPPLNVSLYFSYLHCI